MTSSSLRLQEWLRTTPPATVFVMVLCVILHLWRFITGMPVDLSTVTLCPRLIWYQGDWYRIITSALYHSGFLHLAVNVMSTAAIGTLLEKRLGSLALLVTILWSILLTSIIYILIALLGWWWFESEGLMRQHSVGFSGVLFHLSVLGCNLQAQSSSTSSRSLFGMVRVNVKVYPIALLFALQLLMPGLSFTGHLAGILAGYLHYFECFGFLFPQEAYLREMESWRLLASVAHQLPAFVRTPTTTGSDHPSPSLTAAIGSACQALFLFWRNVLELLLVIIFGRGPQANSNVLFPSLLGHARQQEVEMYDDNYSEEDWSGLPSVTAVESEREAPSQNV